jgi:hypothetical protein
MEYVQQRRFLRRPHDILGENTLEAQYTNLVVWDTPDYKSSCGKIIRECTYYGRDLTWDGGCQTWQRFKSNPLTEGYVAKAAKRVKEREKAEEKKEVAELIQKKALKRIQEQIRAKCAVVDEDNSDKYDNGDEDYNNDEEDDDDDNGTIYSRCTDNTNTSSNILSNTSASSSTSSVNTFATAPETPYTFDLIYESYSYASDIEGLLSTNQITISNDLRHCNNGEQAKMPDKSRLGYTEAKRLQCWPLTRNPHICPWKRASLGFGINIFYAMALQRLECKTRFEQTPSLLVTDFDTSKHYQIHEVRKPLSDEQIEDILERRYQYPRDWDVQEGESQESRSRAEVLAKYKAKQWWIETQRIHDDRFSMWLQEEQELDKRELQSISKQEVEKSEIEFTKRFKEAIRRIKPDEIDKSDNLLMAQLEEREKTLNARAKQQAEIYESLATELETEQKKQNDKYCRDVKQYCKKMEIWLLAKLMAKCAADNMASDGNGVWVGEHHNIQLTDAVLNNFVRNRSTIEQRAAKVSTREKPPHTLYEKGAQHIQKYEGKWKRLTERLAEQRRARSLKVYQLQDNGQCDWRADRSQLP